MTSCLSETGYKTGFAEQAQQPVGKWDRKITEHQVCECILLAEIADDPAVAKA
jgi:hypothetical protein